MIPGFHEEEYLKIVKITSYVYSLDIIGGGENREKLKYGFIVQNWIELTLIRKCI